ncbi:MAG: insulinase family protein [Candidatus Kapabacteria bacterium]|nr:insulinase family protein [Candidatus Kapabacteria bacterium]
MTRSSARSVWTPPDDIILPNGIRIICDPVGHVDSAALGIWVRVGTRDEPRGQRGVAHFVEHTSFRRTRHRTAAKISRDFENRGAYANAYTTKEETCYYVRTLSEHLDDVLDTLLDVVLWPTFQKEDIDKERSIITEEIRSYEDEAEEHIFDLGELQLFPRHPLGSPIVGTVDDVRSLKADDVRSFHARHYHPGSITVAISGRCDADSLGKKIQKLTEGVSKRQRAPRRSTPATRPATHLELTRAIQQAHLLWQTPTIGCRHEDRFALQLLNVVLGDGMSSRLNVRLRESTGLTYTVYSQLQLFADCGILAIYAGVDEQNITKAERGIRRVLHEIADGGITPAEHRRALAQLRAGKLMSLESLTARMTMLGKGVMEQGQPEDPRETIEQFQAVTREDVARLAQRYCKEAAWSTCTLRPSSDRS